MPLAATRVGELRFDLGQLCLVLVQPVGCALQSLRQPRLLLRRFSGILRRGRRRFAVVVDLTLQPGDRLSGLESQLQRLPRLAAGIGEVKDVAGLSRALVDGGQLAVPTDAKFK